MREPPGLSAVRRQVSNVFDDAAGPPAACVADSLRGKAVGVVKLALAHRHEVSQRQLGVRVTGPAASTAETSASVDIEIDIEHK